MQRSAAIVLVVLSSLMLGQVPCCRVHDYAGVYAGVANEWAGVANESANESAGEVAADSAQRGPGEYICPCCNRANPKHGIRTSALASGCDCTPLDGDSNRSDAVVADLPLALPILGDELRNDPGRRIVAVCARATNVPRFVALTLPLLL